MNVGKEGMGMKERMESYRGEHLTRAKELMLNPETYVDLTYGYQTFGSGGYSAGWEVLEGAVLAIPLPNTTVNNGFCYQTGYRLTPVSREVLLKVWNRWGEKTR